MLPKHSPCEFCLVELWLNIDMELLLTYQASQSCEVRSVITHTVIIKINFAKIMVLIGLRDVAIRCTVIAPFGVRCPKIALAPMPCSAMCTPVNLGLIYAGVR
jgi:hypothetical protein